MLIQKAYNNLFPNKSLTAETNLKYSKAFSSFNANIRYTSSKIDIRMSSEWKEISDEIKLGLIETLLAKAFKLKSKTDNMKMYENFLKNLSNVRKYNTEQETDPVLLDSFRRMNEEYFAGMMDQPILKWGSESFTRLGTYEYATDIIKLSTVLEKDRDLLDYVMYHEMLHKKLKFESKTYRTIHHSKEFRRRERLFKIKDVEERLEKFLKSQKRKKFLKFW